MRSTLFPINTNSYYPLFLLVTLWALTLLLPCTAKSQSTKNMEEWERYIESIQARIQEEPFYGNHYLRLAQAYAQLNDESKVLEFTRFAERNGASPIAARIILGDFYYLHGRFDEALDTYSQALLYSPEQAHILVQVWNIIVDVETNDVVIQSNLDPLKARLNEAGYFLPDQFQLVSKKQREKSRNYVQTGNAFLKKDNLHDAILSYQNGIMKDPYNYHSFRGLGIAYARMMNYQFALASYHLYLHLAPHDVDDGEQVRQIILEFYRKGR